jgi:hypothetical protein
MTKSSSPPGWLISGPSTPVRLRNHDNRFLEALPVPLRNANVEDVRRALEAGAGDPHFPSRQGKHLTERAVNYMLKRVAAKVGVSENFSAN